MFLCGWCVSVSIPSLFVSFHCLLHSIYGNALWLTRSVARTLGDTYPCVGWLISKNYSTLEDLRCAKVGHTGRYGLWDKLIVLQYLFRNDIDPLACTLLSARDSIWHDQCSVFQPSQTKKLLTKCLRWSLCFHFNLRKELWNVFKNAGSVMLCVTYANAIHVIPCATPNSNQSQCSMHQISTFLPPSITLLLCFTLIPHNLFIWSSLTGGMKQTRI